MTFNMIEQNSRKPVLVQINVVANWGSTGRTAEEIGQKAIEEGWESYIVYGRHACKSTSHLIKTTNKIGIFLDFILTKLLDRAGLSSKQSTKRLLKELEKIKPDVIHLRNLHGYYINYPILFKYITNKKIPIVWTLHDCWPMTGGCGHFIQYNCYKWQTGCYDCPIKVDLKGRKKIYDRSKLNYESKKKFFTSPNSVLIVGVSEWITNLARHSFFNKYNIININNWVDTDIFSPQQDCIAIREKYNIDNRFILIALATSWSIGKNLNDYLRLSDILSKDICIVLVGLNDNQRKTLPENIIGISRTDSISDLVQLYSTSDILLNLSLYESFGKTTIEAMACGTPAIVYNTTASPELISQETGIVVNVNDINGIKNAIEEIKNNGKSFYSIACRQRVLDLYSKEKNIKTYINLYKGLLKNKL